MFKVECPGCKAPYQVDERRIPSSGLKMRCPKCGTSFKVDPPADGRRTGPSRVSVAHSVSAPTANQCRRPRLAAPAPRPPVDLRGTMLGVAPSGAARASAAAGARQSQGDDARRRARVQPQPLPNPPPRPAQNLKRHDARRRAAARHPRCEHPQHPQHPLHRAPAHRCTRAGSCSRSRPGQAAADASTTWRRSEARRSTRSRCFLRRLGFACSRSAAPTRASCAPGAASAIWIYLRRSRPRRCSLVRPRPRVRRPTC